jgi:hypothetical protein
MLPYMEALVIRDTHKLIANLQKRGFSAQQAEGITDAIKEIDASQLLTNNHDKRVSCILAVIRHGAHQNIYDRQRWFS